MIAKASYLSIWIILSHAHVGVFGQQTSINLSPLQAQRLWDDGQILGQSISFIHPFSLGTCKYFVDFLFGKFIFLLKKKQICFAFCQCNRQPKWLVFNFVDSAVLILKFECIVSCVYCLFVVTKCDEEEISKVCFSYSTSETLH